MRTLIQGCGSLTVDGNCCLNRLRRAVDSVAAFQDVAVFLIYVQRSMIEIYQFTFTWIADISHLSQIGAEFRVKKKGLFWTSVETRHPR